MNAFLTLALGCFMVSVGNLIVSGQMVTDKISPWFALWFVVGVVFCVIDALTKAYK